MGLLTGTQVGAKIVPIDSKDEIAAGDVNYIQGGVHSYPKLNDTSDPELPFNSMYTIPVVRRKWGMFCTVYDDGANNGRYELAYGYADTDISNNDNWKPAVAGGFDPQVIVLGTDPIVAPPFGSEKLVRLNVGIDNQYTIDAPTGSGKIYTIIEKAGARAWFSEAIDGVGPGAPGDPDEDDTVVLAGYNRIRFWDATDTGLYEAL